MTLHRKIQVLVISERGGGIINSLTIPIAPSTLLQIIEGNGGIFKQSN